MLTCVITCVLYQQLGLLFDYTCIWSFIHVWVLGTQCGFFPLCVANFVTALLLMHYSVLCVLCHCVKCIYVYINQLGAH